jgi:hypothetical protein
MCVHIGVTMTSCATIYSTLSKCLFGQATLLAMPCSCATHKHTNTHTHARTRTQERDTHKITSSPTSSAHAQLRTKWTQLMPRRPHACGTKGRDSRGALRAVTPPASCWSAQLLRSCGQQTARQRTHRRHGLRISVGGRPLAARRPHARLHGRRPAHSGHLVQPCTTSMAQTDAHARKRDNSSP